MTVALVVVVAVVVAGAVAAASMGCESGDREAEDENGCTGRGDREETGDHERTVRPFGTPGKANP